MHAAKLLRHVIIKYVLCYNQTRSTGVLYSYLDTTLGLFCCTRTCTGSSCPRGYCLSLGI